MHIDYQLKCLNLFGMSKLTKNTRIIKTEATDNCSPQTKSRIVHSTLLSHSVSMVSGKALSKHNRQKTEKQLQKIHLQQPHIIQLISNRNRKILSSNPETMQDHTKNQLQTEQVPKYQLLSIAGKGNFGTVYRAKCSYDGQTVAIKKILQDKRCKNRQVTVLRQLRHPNIINLKDHYLKIEHNRPYLFLALDYYSSDLASLIKKKMIVKDILPIYLLQVLRGLEYLNEKRIAHRDLKPQNILVDVASHRVVICDFGSAKHLVQGQSNVSYICARGYRAPELVYGSSLYSTSVDMWSFGCIAVQMINSASLFQGKSNIEQMIAIMQILGTPNQEQIRSMDPYFNQREYQKLPKINRKEWKDVLFTEDKQLIDLISKIMVYSPQQRYTPVQSINHAFFDSLRNPTHISYLQNKYGPLPCLSGIQIKQNSSMTTSRVTSTLKKVSSHIKTATTISQLQIRQPENRLEHIAGRDLSDLSVQLKQIRGRLF